LMGERELANGLTRYAVAAYESPAGASESPSPVRWPGA
jgi:hypothetical protein